jgi:hypothetical protein
MNCKTLVERFYETIKDDYPELDVNDIGRICYSALLFVNRAMTLPHVPNIRLKYIGMFGIKKGMAVAAKIKYDNLLKADKINKNVYESEMIKLNHVINRHESKEELEEH